MYGWDMSGRGMHGRVTNGRGLHGFLSYPLVMSGWDISGRAWARQMWAGHVLPLTLFYIRGEQIHPRLIKLCAVSWFDVQTTSNLLTAKTNMSFICVSNFRSLN